MPAGILAAAEIGLPEHADFAGMEAGQLDRLLVLDGVQDPGNLGTLLRTATALGWQGAFLLPGETPPPHARANLPPPGGGASSNLSGRQFSFHRLCLFRYFDRKH